ncbi:MAG: TolC family protein [Isosphaerales bacterium]
MVLRAWMLGLRSTVIASVLLGVGTTGLADSPQSTSPADPAPPNARRQELPSALSSRPGEMPQALPPSTAPREIGPSLPRGDATLGVQLIPGQVLAPIDLAGALRLAGARDLDIAIARQQVWRAVADLSQARALWLPSLFLGPTWARLDGQVQAINGQIQTVSRSSLFLGGVAASANSVAAAPPGSGYPPLTGLSSVLRFSDAIFLPRAARRDLAASQADVQTVTNNAVLAASEAYFDLLLASGLLAIEREAAVNARTLAEITAAYARSREGLEADHQRTLTELDHRRGNIEDAVGQLEVASANLVNLLVLDPNQVLAPVEPAEVVFQLLPDETPLDEMIVQGLRQRPELASAQELVQATLLRLKQARLRPLIPSLAFSYAGGGFGGGQNSFFGNFGSRGDATVGLFWELQNLGFTDRANARRSQADRQTAALRLIKVENQVAADVTVAYKSRLAASRRRAQAAPAVTKGLESLRLNMLNIRGGAGLPGSTRPIEVLQPIQALAQARTDYLNAVLAYNRAQFRLYRAIGQPPLASPPPATPLPAAGATPAPASDGRARLANSSNADPGRVGSRRTGAP